MEKYINQIINKQITIDNEELISDYLNKYGYYRMIDCYGNLTKQIKQSNNITTNEIIDIFLIDNLLSNLMNYYLLDFDKQLNNKVIDIIFKHNNLNDDYVLEIVNNPANNTSLKHKGFATFIKDIYDNAKQCNLINNLDLDFKCIPLRILSTSWSLNTLINFVYLQDESTKVAIAQAYGFDNDYESFISICHTIRKFRNSISHNSIFMKFDIIHFCQPFNKWLNRFTCQQYSLASSINLNKTIQMLSVLLAIDLREILKNQIADMKLFTNIKSYFIKG